MKPIDFRNETFASLKSRLTGQRERVWIAWIAHGPATTTECARRSQISILTLRPRTTELYQLGAVALAPSVPSVPSPDGGIYRARTDAEWIAWHTEHRADTESRQQQLL